MKYGQIQPPGVFAHHRAALTRHYAIMPPEGIPGSQIPGIVNTKIGVQASRHLGAEFAQILLEIGENGGMEYERNDGTQTFFYVVSGNPHVEIGGEAHVLRTGSFAYAPAGMGARIFNPGTEEAQVVWVKKDYEAVDGVPPPWPLVGHQDEVEKVNRHTQGRTWQNLLPNDFAFDFAMNILSFEPGNYFPMVETHVMEHGLYMLEGQGMYLLQNDWHECWERDFIYMAPFCPQFFYATGWSRASYLLYKNVNRDVF